MSKKILIADDDNSIRKIITTLISKKMGCSCVEADNGFDAVLNAFNERPDLILLDYNMPVMHGGEALKQIREHDDPAIRKIPVIMLTSVKERSAIEMLLKLGISGYIVKPFKPQVLCEKINELLQKDFC